MIRFTCNTAALIALAVLISNGYASSHATSAADSPHAYFDALVARPEHWRSFSFRDPAQLETRENGGYANCNKCPLYITYDPWRDPDPRRQDAAKVVIPHTGNNLPNQVRLPIQSSEGNSYLITWDAWFGREYALDKAAIPQQKTFQIASDGIWYEIQSRFNLNSRGLAQITARGYNRTKSDYEAAFGPNVTDTNPLSPMVGEFSIQPETWTRYWALIEQREANYDLASLWAADEHTDPVKLLDGIQLNAANGRIDQFWLEYNTSTSDRPDDRGPLVSYVRNLVMLRNVGSPTSLLQRPLAGGTLPPPTTLKPPAPRNLRLLKKPN